MPYLSNSAIGGLVLAAIVAVAAVLAGAWGLGSMLA